MSDLGTLLDQLNALKLQIFSANQLPCLCCQTKQAILNGLVSIDRPLGLSEVDMIMTGQCMIPCSRCEQLALLQPQFMSLQQQADQAINTTYGVTENPFNL
jgi:hypothetical protein